jgi:hypothetical protein
MDIHGRATAAWVKHSATPSVFADRLGRDASGWPELLPRTQGSLAAPPALFALGSDRVSP